VKVIERDALPEATMMRLLASPGKAPRLPPPGPVGADVFAALFAGAVALFAYESLTNYGFYSCGGPTVQGKNLFHAVGLVGYGSIVEVALILSARKRRNLLAAVLLLGGVGLGAAIDLVALDKATYVVRESVNSAAPEGGCGPNHVSYLYPLWGLSVGVFLVQGLAYLFSEPRSHPRE
jgi:hypothetical protein